jgi:hypothetical protein
MDFHFTLMAADFAREACIGACINNDARKKVGASRRAMIQ